MVSKEEFILPSQTLAPISGASQAMPQCISKLDKMITGIK